MRAVTERGHLRLIAALASLATPIASVPIQASETKAQAVKVTVLSTMLADTDGIGEWGFAAVVDVDGHRLLFDTGAREETVLRNAEELKVDLAGIEDVVLSHHHADHVGGLLTLRRTLAARNPVALSRAHVAPGILLPRRYERGRQGNGNPMIAVRDAYEATGAKLVEHPRADKLAPGVWITGPIKRRFPERNWWKGVQIVTADGAAEDTLPEDQSLVAYVGDGLVVVTGCGHAGIGNILAQARELVPGVPVRAVVGGLHLLDADEESLAWTAAQMREAGVQHLLGAHCTGLEAVFRLRALVGLDRRSAVVGAVGSSYSSAAGIDPRALAR